LVMFLTRFIMPPVAVSRWIVHSATSMPSRFREKQAENSAMFVLERAFAQSCGTFHTHSEDWKVKSAMPIPCDNACTRRSHRRQMYAGRCGKWRNWTHRLVRDDSEARAHSLAVPRLRLP